MTFEQAIAAPGRKFQAWGDELKAALRSGQEVPLCAEASLGASGDPTYSRNELLMETGWAVPIGRDLATWAGTTFENLI